MKKVALFTCLALLLGGCASIPVTQETSKNRKNLAKISAGMLRDKVLMIMGSGSVDVNCIPAGSNKAKRVNITNPYRTETLQIFDRKLEIVYYVIEVQDNCAIDEDKLMPFIFDNNNLIGWGNSFLDSLKKSIEHK